MQAAMGNEENVIISSESNIVKPFCNHFEKMWLELEQIFYVNYVQFYILLNVAKLFDVE